ncbi:hypothetical protein [Ferribacterium limneticum]|uniref:hypothetical protein n=1 Tax=Ferribacterium limneticum TaxID=76259 RepID=UPI001CF86E08|nr:hypothetical protein [Ferribacterium limneticum]UCV21672.1 hypothetical protein KI613_14120 [Ferribacterium limneticum]
MHALTIEYNDSGPLRAVSAERGGLSVHLYNSTEGYLYLRVSVKLSGAEKADYWLKTIKPGDRLKFSYAVTTECVENSVCAIETFAREGETYAVPSGLRLGFDVVLEGEHKVRLSHPPDGGFSFMLANVPRDHARCYVMAGNDGENWNWQLEDLFDGDSIELAIVETNWNTPFPHVETNIQNS